MTSKESDKALRYIATLDQARCQGQWLQVPELARKVEKHAPHRKTLVLVARSEATAATTEVTDRNTALTTLIQPLVSAIANEKSAPEDTFQASVCLAWIHWLLQDPLSVVRDLVDDLGQVAGRVTGKGALSVQWVQVCALKGAYLKGFSLERIGKPVEAERSYRSALPLLSANSKSGLQAPSGREYKLWSERLLCRCVAQPMKARTLDASFDFDKLLKIFHLWTSLLRNTSSAARPLTSHSQIPIQKSEAPDYELGLEVEYSRWDMWMAYYATLSAILKHNLVYSPSYTDPSPQILPSDSELSNQELQNARLRQRTEIKTVETLIETKILDETSFPKANVRNDKVERWVDAVMDNWRIMCGPWWLDEDLGEGGKNAIARGVLDMLYRAATKTFHSTLILRHLFAVHAYLAEFDLAMKALDTYLEMVTKARARAEKSGEPDNSLDDNDKVLSTMSEAIVLICRYGARSDIENSRSISAKLLLWVQGSEIRPEILEGSSRVNGVVIDPMSKAASPATVAQAYHALGVGEATWARVTFEASARTMHQNKALDHFKIATHRKYRQNRNLDYIYSLAVLMAEMRDINGAIKVVKQALAEHSNNSADASYFDEFYERERKLIRFWHLLTLLLSSRADLLSAAKASNAAFEQFQDPGILFGSNQDSYRSEHLNESEKSSKPRSNALVDKMDTLEKAGILQVKMTQVALLEALEGPTSAVDASLDLLALYARLFGEPELQHILKPSPSTAKLPKSRVGSIKDRFRRATSRRRKDTATAAPGTAKSGMTTARPATTATVMAAPKIQVTDLTGSHQARGRSTNGLKPPGTSTDALSKSKERRLSRSLSRKGDIRRNHSNQSANSTRPPSQSTHYTDARSELSESEMNGTITNGTNPRHSFPLRPSTSGSILSKSTITGSAWRGRSSKRDSRFSMATIDSDTTSAGMPQALKPSALIPNPADKKLRQCVLVELWLFVAGMYRRTELFDDAEDATREAEKLVEQIEADVALVSSTAKQFGDKGWGGGKSVDELYGDVWSERACISRARCNPHQALSRYEKALGYSVDHTDGIVGISELLLDIHDEKLAPDADDGIPDYLTMSRLGDGTFDGSASIAETGTIKGSIMTVASNNLSQGTTPAGMNSSTAVSVARAREAVTGTLSRSVTRESIVVTSSSTPGPNSNNRPVSPHVAVGGPITTASSPHPSTSRRPSVVPVTSTASLATSTSVASRPSGLAANITASNAPSSSNLASSSAAKPDEGNEPSPEYLARLAARDRAYLLLSTLTKLGSGWDCSEAWFGLARAYEASGQVDKAKEVLWWCVELEDSRPLRGWEAVGLL